MLYSEKNLDSPIHSTTVGLTSFFQFPLIPSDNQVNKCSLSLISQPIYVIYLFIYLFISSRGFESYKVSSFVHANSISNHSRQRLWKWHFTNPIWADRPIYQQSPILAVKSHLALSLKLSKTATLFSNCMLPLSNQVKFCSFCWMLNPLHKQLIVYLFFIFKTKLKILINEIKKPKIPVLSSDNLVVIKRLPTTTKLIICFYR